MKTTHFSLSVSTIFFFNVRTKERNKIRILTISDEQTISHGLETLIEYYQEPNRGLVTALRNPVLKDPPPHDTRRHGRTNLLHRAIKEGMFKLLYNNLTQKSSNCIFQGTILSLRSYSRADIVVWKRKIKKVKPLYI